MVIMIALNPASTQHLTWIVILTKSQAYKTEELNQDIHACISIKQCNELPFKDRQAESNSKNHLMQSCLVSHQHSQMSSCVLFHKC